MRMRAFFAALALAGTGSAAPVDRAEEIARIHVVAIGGQMQVDALAALRIKGRAMTPVQQVAFTILAARPNRLRMEAEFGERTIVQGSDGVNPPWEREVTAGARSSLMEPAAAERFLADADFDDPLVRWAERGYRLEFAGRVDVDGRKLLRVLVARNAADNVFVLLDPETYFIVLRVQELRKSGRAIEIATHYDDFRPVQGVLLPHAITLFVDGRFSQQAKFESIEPNPKLPADAFAAPKS